MGLKLITPPAEEPVSLDEFKAHAKIETTDDDASIPFYIGTARELVERSRGIATTPSTWELSLDEFPTSEILLPIYPVLSVESIKVDAEDGFEQTLSADSYYLDDASEPSWILPLAAGWGGILSAANAVRIRFVAGYADAASVPFALRAAVLLTATHLYENRTAVKFGPQGASQVMPMGVPDLLAHHRVFL